MVFKLHDLRIWHGAQEIADQIVEFDVGDEMGRLLLEQRSAQHARKA